MDAAPGTAAPRCPYPPRPVPPRVGPGRARPHPRRGGSLDGRPFRNLAAAACHSPGPPVDDAVRELTVSGRLGSRAAVSCAPRSRTGEPRRSDVCRAFREGGVVAHVEEEAQTASLRVASGAPYSDTVRPRSIARGTC